MVLCDLNPVVGTELSGIRPVVVTQNGFTYYRIGMRSHQ
ncbi:hypothetical protein [Pseudanabaena sp. PCC 6802]